VSHELQAVADAQHRRAEGEEALVGGRGISVVNRGGTAGKDDAGRGVGLDLVQRSGTGEHDGEDVQLADAARDELRVLRTEIEDNHAVGVHGLVSQKRSGRVKRADCRVSNPDAEYRGPGQCRLTRQVIADCRVPIVD
jgi:hypothetical protein